MNSFKNASKATLAAASFAMIFSPAFADRDSMPLHIAQAQSNQSSPADQSGASGSTGAGSGQTGQPADSAQGGMSGSSASGTSGTSGTSGASGGSGTAGAQGSSKSQAGQGTAGKSRASGHPPVYMLVPIDIAAQDNKMKNGCWARIYDRENFAGDTLTLTGPIALADMSGPFGLNWDDRVNSIEVGPKATVTVYDNENYRDQVAQFKPAQRAADLSKRMGFFDEFASIKVDCQQG